MEGITVERVLEVARSARLVLTRGVIRGGADARGARRANSRARGTANNTASDAVLNAQGCVNRPPTATTTRPAR